MTQQIFIKSLQCDNSQTAIRESLLRAKGVAAVDFIPEENAVHISGERLQAEEISSILASLGYDEQDCSGMYSKKNYYENWYCFLCSGCHA